MHTNIYIFMSMVYYSGQIEMKSKFFNIFINLWFDVWVEILARNCSFVCYVSNL